MFKFKEDSFVSTIFSDNIFNLFSTRKLPTYKIDQKIFLTIKSKWPFVKILIVPKQIHSNKVKVLYKKDVQNAGNILRIKNFDGVLTELPNIAVGILTADCLPVLLSDGKLVGAYHAGWKGSLKNIAKETIKKFEEIGGRIKKLKVALGPSTGECCYYVNKKRAELFSQAFPDWSNKILSKREGKIYLNLPLLNYLQLIREGVRRENIDFHLFCTSCDQRFFSFRRDGKILGEMISLIARAK